MQDMENRPVELVVFSGAVRGGAFCKRQISGRKAVNQEKPMPNTVRFETIYIPGKVEAVSYRGGKEISRDLLQTSRKPAGIRLHPEKRNWRQMVMTFFI